MNNIRTLLKTILIISIFLSILQLPTEIVTNEHDSASQASYEYSYVKRSVFGVDIIKNIGPLGFLNSLNLYSGYLFYTKLIFSIFLTTCLLYLNPQKNISKYLFLYISLMYLANGNIFIYILLYLCFWNILTLERNIKLYISLIVCSILCLAKSTCTFIVIFGILIYIIKAMLNNKNIFFPLFIFVISLFVIWISTGQNLKNFDDYILGSIIFTKGYNEVMSLEESKLTTLIALLLASFYILLCYKNIASSEIIKKNTIIDSIFYLFLFFIVWKHGMVRAHNSQLSIYFSYIIFVLIFNSKNFLISNLNSFPISKELYNEISIISILLSFYFVIVGAETTINAFLKKPFFNVINNTYYLINLKNLKSNLQNKINIFKNNMELRTFQEIVKNNEIGYLGIYPAVMLYNNFNYIESPSVISFVSWNSELMTADEEFFRNKVDYVIVDLKTIDNRYLPQDSNIVKLVLLNNFEIVKKEKNYILMKKIKSLNIFNNKKRILISKEFILNEWQNIDKLNNKYWLSVDLELNYLETFISFFYKPSFYTIEFLDNNKLTKKYKYIPTLGKNGFMINPIVLNNNDFDILFTHKKPLNSTYQQFKIICNGNIYICKKKGKYQIYEYSNI